MLKVAVAGSQGRMGKALVEALSHSQDAYLSAATVSPRYQGGSFHPIQPVTALIEIINQFDVLIDFTTPEATLSHLALCRAHGKKMVIGTTGWRPEEKQLIEAASKTIPIFFSPNMSMGMNLCFHVLKEIAKRIGEEVDIEIIEAHHRHKKDLPSGTALKMGEILQSISGKKVGFSSLRAGDISGEHTALFALEGERLEITHRASDRVPFAKGAVRAATWLADKPPGLYSMEDMLTPDLFYPYPPLPHPVKACP